MPKIKLDKLIAIVSFSFVFTSLGIYSFHLFQGRNFDWLYFDALAAVIRSSFLHYGVLPIHDPWACSGTSLLSNPQQWIFSPFVLLTIFFSPSIGNILSILLLKLIGFWGTFRYFKSYRVDHSISYLCSALFINANWFSLHFSEGHVAFRSFYLLPWVFLYFENLNLRKDLLKLGALLLFFILDGGFYPFIFSLIYFFLILILSSVIRGRLIGFIKKDMSFFFLVIFSFSLISLLKIFPILVNSHVIKSVQERLDLNGVEIFEIFFNPFKNNSEAFWGYLRFHEFGSYTGVCLVLLLGFLLIKKGDELKNNKTLIFVALFFLWIGLGIFGIFNPYSIISSIPLIKKAHVQSRYLIFFILFLILIVGKLSTGVKNKVLIVFLLIGANLEFLVSNHYSFNSKGLEYDLPLITKDTWKRTDANVSKPALYYQDGIISRACYEPAHTLFSSSAAQDPGYLGEFLNLSGDIMKGDVSYTPGEISFFYSSKGGGELLLNTHYLDGWIETNSNGEAFNFRNLLAVRLPAGEGEVRLQYRPYYFYYIFLFPVIGLCILLLLLRKKNEF